MEGEQKKKYGKLYTKTVELINVNVIFDNIVKMVTSEV